MNNCKNCGEQTHNKNFCTSSCYGIWQRGKGFYDQGKKIRAIKKCLVDGCVNIHFGRGYCRKHYVKFILNNKQYEPKTEYICEQCGNTFKANKRSGNKIPRFCSFGCAGLFKKKPYIIKKGYKKLLIPNHPRSDRKGYVFEHIIIAEAYLGESLKPFEVVHHIDRNKLNNSIDNLKIFKNNHEHLKFHAMTVPDKK